MGYRVLTTALPRQRPVDDGCGRGDLPADRWGRAGRCAVRAAGAAAGGPPSYARGRVCPPGQGRHRLHAEPARCASARLSWRASLTPCTCRQDGRWKRSRSPTTSTVGAVPGDGEDDGAHPALERAATLTTLRPTPVPVGRTPRRSGAGRTELTPARLEGSAPGCGFRSGAAAARGGATRPRAPARPAAAATPRGADMPGSFDACRTRPVRDPPDRRTPAAGTAPAGRGGAETRDVGGGVACEGVSARAGAVPREGAARRVTDAVRAPAGLGRSAEREGAGTTTVDDEAGAATGTAA